MAGTRIIGVSGGESEEETEESDSCGLSLYLHTCVEETIAPGAQLYHMIIILYHPVPFANCISRLLHFTRVWPQD